MGFKDEYPQDTSGAPYLTGDEKDALLASGDVFTITAVRFDPKGGFDNADRYVLSIILGDEERRLSFQAASVDSRDRNLANMADYLAANAGDTIDAQLEAAGRATLVIAV